MSYPVERVADSIIDLCRKRSFETTNLKLQKLMYYAQAWRLVFAGSPLFTEPIEAWVHGPVVPSVFRRFKSYRWSEIDSPVQPIEDVEVNGHINHVLDSYGKYTATQLERLTHREDPWKDARKGLEPDEPSQNVISCEAMRRFYSQLLNAR